MDDLDALATLANISTLARHAADPAMAIKEIVWLLDRFVAQRRLAEQRKQEGQK